MFEKGHKKIETKLASLEFLAWPVRNTDKHVVGKQQDVSKLQLFLDSKASANHKKDIWFRTHRRRLVIAYIKN